MSAGPAPRVSMPNPSSYPRPHVPFAPRDLDVSSSDMQSGTGYGDTRNLLLLSRGIIDQQDTYTSLGHPQEGPHGGPHGEPQYGSANSPTVHESDAGGLQSANEPSIEVKRGSWATMLSLSELTEENLNRLSGVSALIDLGEFDASFYTQGNSDTSAKIPLQLDTAGIHDKESRLAGSTIFPRIEQADRNAPGAVLSQTTTSSSLPSTIPAMWRCGTPERDAAMSVSPDKISLADSSDPGAGDFTNYQQAGEAKDQAKTSKDASRAAQWAQQDTGESKADASKAEYDLRQLNVVNMLLDAGPNEDIIYNEGAASDSFNKAGYSLNPSSTSTRLPRARDGSFTKFTELGPKANLTGTPNGTNMKETGSSIADSSSPGAPIASSSARAYKPSLLT
ncbi:hypothetical protein LTS18_012032, partial [Coniosporium uncinatum]